MEGDAASERNFDRLCEHSTGLLVLFQSITHI
jgi:hypothetical protein